MKNPFKTKYGEVTCAEDRIRRVKEMKVPNLKRVLSLPNIQITVTGTAMRRLMRLSKKH